MLHRNGTFANLAPRKSASCERTHTVYGKWTAKVGADLVKSAEKIIGSTK